MALRGVQSARYLSATDTKLPGVRRIVKVAAPAAASNWTVTVPSGRQWRVIGGSAQFNADATVGNRSVGIAYTVEGVLAYQGVSSLAIAATGGQKVVYCYGSPAYLTGASAGALIVGIPTIWLAQQSIVSSATVFAGVADQWTGVNLLVEELYVTDEQYSDIEVEREATEREIADYLEQSWQ